MVQHADGWIYGLALGGMHIEGVFYGLSVNLGAKVKLVLSSGKVGGTVELLGGGFKAAFGMFSDTLRMELHLSGLHVSVIEPGAIRTPAVDKTLGDMEAVIDSLPPKGAAQYGEMLRTVGRRAYQQEMGGSSPDIVAKAVHHALTANRPKARYRVGKHATLLGALAWLMPDRLLDSIRFRITGMPTRFGTVDAAEERQVQRAA